jgi:hypothetical protein
LCHRAEGGGTPMILPIVGYYFKVIITDCSCSCHWKLCHRDALSLIINGYGTFIGSPDVKKPKVRRYN